MHKWFSENWASEEIEVKSSGVCQSAHPGLQRAGVRGSVGWADTKEIGICLILEEGIRSRERIKALRRICLGDQRDPQDS